ncbi:MAG TPA: hypothetical protein VGD77_13475 [Gemmatimonadaceae bacterium]
MRRTLRAAFAAATVALLGATAPSRLAAQEVVPASDEGMLVLRRGSEVIGREAFRIARGADGNVLYSLSATVSLGERRITPSLSTDGSGTPLLYRAEASTGGSRTERVRATGRPGRLSAVLQQTGAESAREYILAGRALLLDEDIYHQYALVPLAAGDGAAGGGAVTVVVPRRGQQLAARIERRAEGTVTVDGRAVPASHWAVVAPDGTREVWLDGAGRLLRVSAGGVTATREELPR